MPLKLARARFAGPISGISPSQSSLTGKWSGVKEFTMLVPLSYKATLQQSNICDNPAMRKKRCDNQNRF
jgi:hypothetical protein